ncbi:porin family protein [Altererythrobacter salegens]|uniref:Porin family protein n=1 Tax=Croceibacterium salegens TaxID=1737568 RepID=A0A6I4SW89_9SPHN|nr:porin family protein [Croceibacterium salegens]MXO59056.1 porin family protein [Croceibacterium salegens]
MNGAAIIAILGLPLLACALPAHASETTDTPVPAEIRIYGPVDPEPDQANKAGDREGPQPANPPSPPVAQLSRAYVQSSLVYALPPSTTKATYSYGPADPQPARLPPPGEDAAQSAAGSSPEEPEDDGPLFPIWGKQARERGIVLLPAFGMAGLVVDNRQTLTGENLAIALAKGGTIASDANLADLPFVVPTKLKSHTTNYQFKADLWVFPFLDVFATIGKTRGKMDIAVDIDLDAFVPFPFCRPAKPCGIINLPFEADVNNTTFTGGAIAAYGSDHWFISASAAKTIAVAKKDRSDIQTTDLGVRGGPRFNLGGDVVLSAYVGADYFDFKTRVTGQLVTGPLFDDGDPLAMKYELDLRASKPWAAIMGGNLQFGRHWTMQGEYNLGQGSNRFTVSLTFRP